VGPHLRTLSLLFEVEVAMHHPLRSVLSVLSVSVLLAACGGGDEGAVVDESNPSPTSLSASLTVAASTSPELNGVYSSNAVALNNVTKVNPIGGEPETCRFRFSGLRQAGTTRTMDGDIRYIPGTSDTRTVFVSIDTIEYRLVGTAGASVDRTNGRVNFTNAVLGATQSTGSTINLTGSIPMLGNRPEGC
jgi:hypothetical protein